MRNVGAGPKTREQESNRPGHLVAGFGAGMGLSSDQKRKSLQGGHRGVESALSEYKVIKGAQPCRTTDAPWGILKSAGELGRLFAPLLPLSLGPSENLERDPHRTSLPLTAFAPTGWRLAESSAYARTIMHLVRRCYSPVESDAGPESSFRGNPSARSLHKTWRLNASASKESVPGLYLEFCKVRIS